jgi:hypothetical protein
MIDRTVIRHGYDSGFRFRVVYSLSGGRQARPLHRYRSRTCTGPGNSDTVRCCIRDREALRSQHDNLGTSQGADGGHPGSECTGRSDWSRVEPHTPCIPGRRHPDHQSSRRHRELVGRSSRRLGLSLLLSARLSLRRFLRPLVWWSRDGSSTYLGDRMKDGIHEFPSWVVSIRIRIGVVGGALDKKEACS